MTSLLSLVRASTLLRREVCLETDCSLREMSVACCTNMSEEKCIYASASQSLLKEVDSVEPSAERVVSLLSMLRSESEKGRPILESTEIDKVLSSTVKSCRRHKRSSDNREQWETAIEIAESLLTKCADVYKDKTSATMSTTTATSSLQLEETSSESTSLLSQAKKRFKKGLGNITSIFRKNTVDYEDGNNQHTLTNHPTARKTMQWSLGA